jgi:hypothetical protein
MIDIEKLSARIKRLELIDKTPDYANQETTSRISTNNGTWTADRSGYVNCGAVGTGAGNGGVGGFTVTVNNVLISRNVVYGTDTTRTYILQSNPIEVSKNDVIKIQWAWGVFTSCSCYFIPYKNGGRDCKVFQHRLRLQNFQEIGGVAA